MNCHSSRIKTPTPAGCWCRSFHRSSPTTWDPRNQPQHTTFQPRYFSPFNLTSSRQCMPNFLLCKLSITFHAYQSGRQHLRIYVWGTTFMKPPLFTDLSFVFINHCDRMHFRRQPHLLAVGRRPWADQQQQLAKGSEAVTEDQCCQKARPNSFSFPNKINQRQSMVNSVKLNVTRSRLKLCVVSKMCNKQGNNPYAVRMPITCWKGCTWTLMLAE